MTSVVIAPFPIHSLSFLLLSPLPFTLLSHRFHLSPGSVIGTLLYFLKVEQNTPNFDVISTLKAIFLIGFPTYVTYVVQVVSTSNSALSFKTSWKPLSTVTECYEYLPTSSTFAHSSMSTGKSICTSSTDITFPLPHKIVPIRFWDPPRHIPNRSR